MWWKKRNKPEQTIGQDDLDWVKETLARLLIENGVLRLVTAHLIVAKCKETEDPQLALRDLHRALVLPLNSLSRPRSQLASRVW